MYYITILRNKEAGIEELMPAKSDLVLKATLYQGKLSRSGVADMLRTSDHTARPITSALIESDTLKSASSRTPLLLAFPAQLVGH
jgi:uncharacterized protein YwbE